MRAIEISTTAFHTFDTFGPYDVRVGAHDGAAPVFKRADY
jgi:hypothetical protein